MFFGDTKQRKTTQNNAEKINRDIQDKQDKGKILSFPALILFILNIPVNFFTYANTSLSHTSVLSVSSVVKKCVVQPALSEATSASISRRLMRGYLDVTV